MEQAGRLFFSKVAAGFGVAAAILVVIGMASYQSMRGFLETAELETRTYVVLSELKDVLSTVQDAETGQRGYIITGEARYLEPYKMALASGEQTRDLPALARTPVADHTAAWIVHPHPDIANLIPEFLDSMRKCVVSLRQALDQRDYATLTRLGHRMKGDGGSFGFDMISTYGAALEEAAQHKNAAAIRRSIAALTSYLDQVRVVMD